jgi:UDP-glucose 4-epimerase
MKVVLTGASGNVGTALLRELAGKGWDLVGVARRRPPHTAPYSAARWFECDIGTSDGARVLSEVYADADAVVHLAWSIHPRTDEPPMHRTNVLGSGAVLRAVATARVPQLVCASSVAAYTAAGRWRRVTEDWPCGGVHDSAYSVGKSVFEQQLDSFGREHPRIRIARIRPCAILQPDAAAQFADWLLSPWLPRKLLGRHWFPLPLGRELRMQIVHAADVAKALRLVLDRRAQGAFNLAGEPVLTGEDLARAAGGLRVPVPLAPLAGAAWATWRLGSQPLHPAWLRLADQASLVDSRRAREELGWTPGHGVRDTLGEVIAAIRDGRRGPSAPLCSASRRVRFGRPSHQSQGVAGTAGRRIAD